MPKKSKVSPVERREWLEKYEDGVRLDVLAKVARRDARTISTHIEKARLDRDFIAAQREQLREALQAHQRDMLELVDQLGRVVFVLPLSFLDPLGLDFGLEDLRETSDFSRNQELSLDSAGAIKVTRNSSGPQEVTLTLEGTRLWRALREHTGKDPLWRSFANWKDALTQELRLRADLNRAIRITVEGNFGLPVARGPARGEPWLGPAAVWWLRTRLTNLALGEYVPEVGEDVRQASTGGLESKSGKWLADHLEDTEKGIGQLRETTAAPTAARWWGPAPPRSQ